jgi:hypothetical protein
MRRAFIAAARRSREEAVSLLQDEHNSFPVLYLLAPEVERLGLAETLPERARHAMYITLRRGGASERAELYRRTLTWDENAPDGTREPPYDCIAWMIRTGAAWDGPSAGHDDFDAAMDLAAAYLAEKYDEPELLAMLVELMFRRNRKGLPTHDLVWGFFRTADPGALAAIAKYLLSDDAADVELTCELMGFEKPEGARARRALYEEYTAWLAENRPYLYVTGEHFNQTSMPYHVRHDREAKFLKHEISPRDRTPKAPLTENEYRALEVFRAQREEVSEI